MVRALAAVNAVAQTYVGAMNDWPTTSVVIVVASWVALAVLMLVRRTK